MLALQAYSYIQDILEGRYIQVHLDVNNDPIHASNAVTSQALGWVRSMGIVAQIKPDSFAASHAADHCVRGKKMN